MAQSRNGVTKARRRAAFHAANLTCVTCGVVAREVRWPRSSSYTFPTDEPGNPLSIDHITPGDASDLAVLCFRCNTQKSNRPPTYDLVVLALLRTTVVHLALAAPPPHDILALTLCRRVPARRLGGWPIPRRTEPRPTRICQRCWAAARGHDAS